MLKNTKNDCLATSTEATSAQQQLRPTLTHSLAHTPVAAAAATALPLLLPATATSAEAVATPTTTLAFSSTANSRANSSK